jgi:AraC-like DNA-binding protein
MDFYLNANVFPKSTYINRNTPLEPWIHFPRTTWEYILFIIKSGTLYLKEADTKYVLQEGDMLLLEPGLHHVGYLPAQVDFYFVHMHRETFRPVGEELIPGDYFKKSNQLMYVSDPYNYDLYESARPLFPKHLHLPAASCKFIIEKIDETIIALSNKDFHYKLLCSSAMLQILLHIANEYRSQVTAAQDGKNTKYGNEKLQIMLTYLQQHYQTKVTGDGIESDLHMNFDHLNRIFKKDTGITIFEYLQLLRINRAKEYLVTTDMRIYEVATTCGFSNEYHFNRVFTKNTGITPLKYRTRYK